MTKRLIVGFVLMLAVGGAPGVAFAEDECLIVATGVTRGSRGNLDGTHGGLIAPDGSIAELSAIDPSTDYLDGVDVEGDRVTACFNRALLLMEEFCEQNKKAAFQLHGAHIGNAMLMSSSYFTESKLNRWGMIACSNGDKTVHFRAWRNVGTSDFEERDIPIRCFKKTKHPVDEYLY